MLNVNRYLPAVFFTSSGMLLILATILTYFFLASPLKDIIALVILSTFAVLLFTFIVLILLWSRRLKDACKFKLGTSAGIAQAGQQTLLLLEFKPFALPPLCELEVSLHFAGRPKDDLKLFTTGATRTHNCAQVDFCFPHRGVWQIDLADHRLSDSFGLLRYYWKRTTFTEPAAIKVQPRAINYQGIPTLASTYREGDDLPFPRTRKGDYYDFRRYNPSDGSRRILWKIYARSQNLLSRHPEESVAPAGLAVLYCLALADDDKLAASFVHYLSDLEQADVDLVAGCLGAKDQTVTTSTEAAELVITAAFAAGYQINSSECLKNFVGFQEQASSMVKGLSIESMILFVSDRYFREPNALGLLEALCKQLENKNVTPIFCYIEDQSIQNKTAEALDSGSPTTSVLRSWFLEESLTNKPVSDSKVAFVELCRNRGWEFHQGSFRL